MARFHIERDSNVISTEHFIVEAATLDDAIKIVDEDDYECAWRTTAEGSRAYVYDDSCEVHSGYRPDIEAIRRDGS